MTILFCGSCHALSSHNVLRHINICDRQLKYLKLSIFQDFIELFFAYDSTWHNGVAQTICGSPWGQELCRPWSILSSWDLAQCLAHIIWVTKCVSNLHFCSNLCHAVTSLVFRETCWGGSTAWWEGDRSGGHMHGVQNPVSYLLTWISYLTPLSFSCLIGKEVENNNMPS